MQRRNYPLLCLLLCLSLSIGATTYYLDYRNGANSNDGLSPATAWKDLFKIRAANPSPGDVFLFKRGERWEGLQLYIDASGTEDEPIVYGAYGDPADPLPVISSIAPLAGATATASWSEAATNIWTMQLARTPGRLFLDGVEYLRASTLAELGTTDSEGAFGQWFYDAGSQLLYLYNTQNPAVSYGRIAGSLHFASVLVFVSDHLEFEELDIRGGSGASLSINGGAHISVFNCRLGRFANSGITLIDQLYQGVRHTASYITVEQNVFDSDFTFFYGLGSERGCGDGIKLFYGVDHCTISNNTFINWAHNAVELLGNRADAAGVLHNQIYDNYITAPDIPYAHPFGADGLLDKCSGNVFYRNYIENCRTASQINGNDNWVHHNIIIGMRNSPAKNAPTAYAFISGIYGSGLVSQDNRFDHNLIIDTDEAAFLIRGYGFSGQVHNVAIRNNILYNTGRQPLHHAYDQNVGIVLFDTPQNGVGGNTFRNNLFFNDEGIDNSVYIQDEDAYYSSEAFNALNGMDGNVIEDNIFGDPLFADLAHDDYQPAAGSPVINAGLDVGIELDFALQPRVVGPAPDIGPYETTVDDTWSQLWLAVLANKKVQLSWESHSARYSRHYNIERKSDGGSWQLIHQLPAHGNSRKPIRYVFLDKEPPAGIVSYRVQRIDLNGVTSYSEIRQIEVGNGNDFSLARPDDQTILVTTAKDGDWSRVQIKIYSYDGRSWGTITGDPTVPLRHLPAGVYFLQIRQGRQIVVKSFVK